MRIIRTAFYITLAVFLMPTPPEQANDPATGGGANLAAQDVIAAAIGAVGDVRGFCERRQEVCVTAGHLITRFEAKARYSVRLLYEWANEANAIDPRPATPVPANQAAADPLITNSLATFKLASASSEAGPDGDNTLRLDDIIPPWRGPKPRQRG